MSRLLKPVRIVDHSELVELVSGAIGEIINAGALVDAALGNEEFGYFDLVAANENREGVLFFINFSGDEPEYLRLLKCMHWYEENLDTIQKLHAGRVAFGAGPPVYVVAPMYSCSMRKVLLNMREGRITLLRFVCFQDGNGEKSLFIEEVGDPDVDTIETGPMRVFETLSVGPSADRPEIRPAEAIMCVRKFRREIEADISNVSDEELVDLLG